MLYSLSNDQLLELAWDVGRWRQGIFRTLANARPITGTISLDPTAPLR